MSKGGAAADLLKHLDKPVQSPTKRELPTKKSTWTPEDGLPPGMGGGTVGILAGETARYHHFTQAMNYCNWPPDTKPCLDPGIDIVRQSNNFIKHARETGADWLWIIGDDHVWNPWIIQKLYSNNVDVVVPNCLQRSWPFHPVIYNGLDEQGQYEADYVLPEHELKEVYAAGTAGMLIRKHVIDALPEKPFTTSGGHLNEDLEFCRNVREAGFKIWCDPAERLAHVGTMIVWPKWFPDTQSWGTELTLGPAHNGVLPNMPLRRHPGAGTALSAA